LDWNSLRSYFYISAHVFNLNLLLAFHHALRRNIPALQEEVKMAELRRWLQKLLHKSGAAGKGLEAGRKSHKHRDGECAAD
jgi:hypothetical protein